MNTKDYDRETFFIKRNAIYATSSPAEQMTLRNMELQLAKLLDNQTQQQQDVITLVVLSGQRCRYLLEKHQTFLINLQTKRQSFWYRVKEVFSPE
jgi:hypothetical protein